MKKTRELIERAIGLCGTQAKLAAAVGVKQQSIWQAKQAGRVSAELALGIHRATDGRISAAALRPDLWASTDHVPQSGKRQRSEGAAA